jgi:small-conductance mechanosensitive channel
MQTLSELFELTFLGNSLRDWLLAALVFAATFLIVPFIRGRIRAQQQRWKDAHSPALELLSLLAARTNRLVLLSVALYFAEKYLTLPAQVDGIFDVIIVFGIAVQLALWAATALRFMIERHYARAGTDDAGARSSVGVLMFVAQGIIWAVFALLALDNLGVNITALVAGMGVGGIAIALAVQTILGDLFGSMSIALDKPFAVGDALRIDDVEGTVEHIGIKSTRLRSVTGEQIILSNADVLKSRVRNLGRMPEKRVSARLRVGFETSSEQMAHISALVKDAVAAAPGTRFVSCLLVQIGEYALEFEAIYFVDNTRDAKTAGTVDAVNRGIVARFAAAGISFAYPTRRQADSGSAAAKA